MKTKKQLASWEVARQILEIRAMTEEARQATYDGPTLDKIASALEEIHSPTYDVLESIQRGDWDRGVPIPIPSLWGVGGRPSPSADIKVGRSIEWKHRPSGRTLRLVDGRLSGLYTLGYWENLAVTQAFVVDLLEVRGEQETKAREGWAKDMLGTRSGQEAQGCEDWAKDLLV